MTEPAPESSQETGLLQSLRRLLATLLEIVQTRIDIVVNELEEERVRLQDLVLFGALTLFFVTVGLTLVTLFVVSLFWDTHRLAVLGGVAALYLVLGAGTGLVLVRQSRSRHRLFSTTLSELAKDRQRVNPHDDEAA